jgi:ParB/RepB/Spo0J family partition protein
MKKTKNAAERIVSIDPFRVKPFAEQPRKQFSGIKELAANIETLGQLTPIVVSPVQEPNYDYELIDGERRLRACRLAKIEIEAVVRKDPGGERFALSVASNFHRQAHHAIEIVEAIARLKQAGRTIEEIAAIFGKSRTWVFQYASIAKLEPEIQRMMIPAAEGEKRGSGRLTLHLALLLIPLPPAVQLRAARQITEKKMDLVAARRYVRQQAEIAHVEVGKVRTANDHLNRLISVCQRTRNLVGEYLDMPPDKFRRIKMGAAPQQRRKIDATAEKLTEELLALAEALNA